MDLIRGAFRPVEAVGTRVVTAGKNIGSKMIEKNPHGILGAIGDAPGKLITSTATEGLKLIGGTAADLLLWTKDKSIDTFIKTTRLALSALSLIPLPLPGPYKNIAEIRAEAGMLKQAYQLKLAGEPERIMDVFATLKKTRADARARTNPSQAPTSLAA